MRIINAPRILSCLLALLFLLPCSTYADLNNPIYVEAKNTYDKNEYEKTLDLLAKYKSADEQFLKGHSEISKIIDDAIAYCKIKTSKEFRGKGVTDWRPTLPNATP